MPFKLMTLTELQQTTTVAGQYDLGNVAELFDATYGPLKAVYCHTVGAVDVAMSPMYEKIAAGVYWTIDDDENGSGVIGQEACIGTWLGGITTAVAYGWVLVAGLNPVALTTDGTVDAGEGIIGTATDGTWGGVPATQNVAVTTATSTYNTIGYVPAVALTADLSTNVLSAGCAMFNSMWSGLKGE
jgi:hypothetical protein